MSIPERLRSVLTTSLFTDYKMIGHFRIVWGKWQNLEVLHFVANCLQSWTVLPAVCWSTGRMDE